MARAVLLAIVGALAGGGATVLFVKALQHRDVPGAEVIGDTASAARPPDGVRAPTAFDVSRAAHQRAAEWQSVDEILLAIERAAEGEPAAEQRAEIDALLARLAETDARAAVEHALRLELGEARVARLYQAWAVEDAEAALAQLGALRPPSTQRTVALSLLDVFGLDDAGVERIAAALTSARASHFRIDAIGRLAERDVSTALDRALGLPFNAAQTVALQRIADTMATVDPASALEQSSRIPVALQRTMYRERLLNAWANVEPDAMLAWFETADLSGMPVNVQAFRAIAASDPERLLEVASTFPPINRRNAQQAAFEALVDIDPTMAYAEIMALPPTGDRNLFVQGIAERLVQQNPSGALAWATSLAPRSAVATEVVLSRLAITDPISVADAVIAEIVDPVAAMSGSVPSVSLLMTQAMRAGAAEVGLVAEKLASHDDPHVRQQLENLLVVWPQWNAAHAVEWGLDHADLLNRDSGQQMGRHAASIGRALSADAVAGMPAHIGEAWVQGYATGLAESDLDAALRWLEGFDGERIYDSARRSALSTAARTEPQKVASLLTGQMAADPAMGQVVTAVGSNWALQDPPGAAEWFRSLADLPDSQRGRVANSIATQWASRDFAEANDWVRNLPAGAVRDGGLAGLVQRAAGAGRLDERMFEEFSTPETRSTAVMNSLLLLGGDDPELARRLIAAHIPPQQQEAAERQLELALQLSSGVSVGLGIGNFINVPATR